jgi:hypothetical protein
MSVLVIFNYFYLFFYFFPLGIPIKNRLQVVFQSVTSSCKTRTPSNIPLHLYLFFCKKEAKEISNLRDSLKMQDSLFNIVTDYKLDD